jgi:hypothetical protein
MDCPARIDKKREVQTSAPARSRKSGWAKRIMSQASRTTRPTLLSRSILSTIDFSRHRRSQVRILPGVVLPMTTTVKKRLSLPKIKRLRQLKQTVQ